MKKVIMVLLFSLLVMLPSGVYASTCSYTDKAFLSKKATNIVSSYTYVENGDNVTFNVTLTNMTPEFYIIDKTNNQRYNYNGTQEITIYGYAPGTRIQYEIHTVLTECYSSYITIDYVNLPDYNKYYKDPLCIGKESYSVCNKWSKAPASYEEFKKRINSISSDQEQKGENKEENKTTIFDQIYNFLHNYYPYIIVGLAVITLITIFIKTKKTNYGF